MTAPTNTPTIETWTERVRRLRNQHRLYLTEWVAGNELDDLLAQAHERDIRYAARCLGVPLDEIVRRLERE